MQPIFMSTSNIYSPVASLHNCLVPHAGPNYDMGEASSTAATPGLPWMRTWLVNRSQQVVLEGEHSERSVVKSGVPQGTVLGPLCFLLYINDMGNDISSNLKRFADDSLMYGLVHNVNDALLLQQDLNKLVVPGPRLGK
jgi:hypothetical protein